MSLPAACPPPSFAPLTCPPLTPAQLASRCACQYTWPQIAECETDDPTGIQLTCESPPPPFSPPSPPSPPPSPTPPSTAWSLAQCVGQLSTTGFGSGSDSLHLIRNLGAGTQSPCCGHHWESAHARISDHAAGAFELRLLGVGSGTDANGRRSRRSARVYLGNECEEGRYDPAHYARVFLLGKTLAYTVDLSAASCGCNAALYLVNLAQSTSPGWCRGDYYCDANSQWVCGNACAEIDVMEANLHAWHTVLHTAWDGSGRAVGLGGGASGLSSSQYGPGTQRTINTRSPFRVHAYFHSDAARHAFRHLEVILVQGGRSVSFSVGGYQLEAMGAALRAGMSVVGSYWSSSSMAWLSGGVCTENQAACGEAVQYSRFTVCDGRSTACS